ncbi:hypothetical protein FHR32_001540 [Streptosporangium album]|uniref:Uncharacterized protein n=1 Tax=Streptosporangium album TaxID=47479 RepID=A0A7W7RS76_9ACTN|nr:hypothetical protein [Streptosporangium album]MBB4937235.1 hypothetical protein [Streptosporangium album]
MSLVLVVILAAIAPSPWSGGWQPTDTGTSLWVPQTDGSHHTTAPRLLAGGAEHLPTPGQLRSLLAVGATVTHPLLLSPAWLSTGPAAIPRRDVQRVVTSRSPPRS